jgi:hypothetical protein
MVISGWGRSPLPPPQRGALVAGVDEKGAAKPAGIEPGDVIVNFDGKEIKAMRDLPRVVADTRVGKTRSPHPPMKERQLGRAAQVAGRVGRPPVIDGRLRFSLALCRL